MLIWDYMWYMFLATENISIVIFWTFVDIIHCVAYDKSVTFGKTFNFCIEKTVAWRKKNFLLKKKIWNQHTQIRFEQVLYQCNKNFVAQCYGRYYPRETVGFYCIWECGVSRKWCPYIIWWVLFNFPGQKTMRQKQHSVHNVAAKPTVRLYTRCQTVNDAHQLIVKSYLHIGG